MLVGWYSKEAVPELTHPDGWIYYDLDRNKQVKV